MTVPNATTKQKIDQSTLTQLLVNQAELGTATSLANLLDIQGYSTIISDVNLELSNLNTLDLSGCQFTRVNFSGEFNNKTFENVEFHDSHFAQANFAGSTFDHVLFEHCYFEGVNFKGSSHLDTTLKEGILWGADFSDSSFYHSNLRDTIFSKTQFENVLDLENSLQDLHIIFNQDVPPDYAFQNAEFHQVIPNVVIVEDAQWYSTPHHIVSEYSGNPQTITPYYSFDHASLYLEVQKVLVDIEKNGLQDNSIPQQILHSDQLLINQIKANAFEFMQENDALWIPGSGDDIHPEFYGQAQLPETDPSASYYREILEFALTEAAIALNKPILGICHGSQMVNVYLGGTLHQHVEGQWGIKPELTVLTDKGPLGSAIQGTILGPSYHHQAVDKVGEGLEVVAKYGDIVKATQANDAKPIMLCQFHPEYQVDQNSKNILQRFMDLSSESAVKTETLKISDLLHLDTHLFQDSSEYTSIIEGSTAFVAQPVTSTLPAIETHTDTSLV